MSDEDRYDAGAVVRAVNLPVGSDGPGFTVGRADGETGSGLTGTVGAAVEISSYVDAILDALDDAGVEESHYEELPELPKRRDDREEGVEYRPVVAHVRVDTDADPEDPEAFTLDLTPDAERRVGEALAAESERARELDREETDGGWNPEPATLRDGETTDLSGHARANLETVNRAEDEGYLSSDEAEQARETIRENDEEDP